MPELPEAEVVRRGLARWVAGRVVESVHVLDARSVRRHVEGPDAFVQDLTGCRVLDVVRRGKFLWMPLQPPEQGGAGGTFDADATFDGGLSSDPAAQDSAAAAPAPALALMAHLGMSGQMLVKNSELPDDRHLRIRLTLSEAPDPEHPGATLPGELRFVDQRIFGGMFIDDLVPTADGAPAGQGLRGDALIPEHAAHIARDPLDPAFDMDAVHERLRRRRTGIKRALLDQGLVSGIGNIYADEALWEARLHYARPTETLTRAETRRVLEAVQTVMTRALEAGGTSFDSLYVNVNGESGYFALSLNAYGQTGEPCPRCAAAGREGVIVREQFMNRSSFRCSVCQRKPRNARF
ncbi:bifunctional DNA-formamidopyrimidine glycosylase/DNA-(apurinic or apyrimidinic site) lyase [Kocuria sp.]|uniref:bifunctional DNA-formamidopyrimidine glycosylase/DNA-(apurinic or apyrimidinic site) lyase n=1 Tax=Kocuria sp. TaxID=1871328 RepID=UPI0026E04812|nr:bifunctional DNA-formamidopyrimidine glycosylase/DNA-(apurinic or apyrimidinic site) lyase [Kocuria sp.]MDO5618314.1 bifunctional DNA-formamidopyrimidine glycosylase/DNA-(apurinic or apyrimidinic site) lyase [Kocuria sp.]